MEADIRRSCLSGIFDLVKTWPKTCPSSCDRMLLLGIRLWMIDSFTWLLTCPKFVSKSTCLIMLPTDVLIMSLRHGMVIRKYERSSLVSISAGEDPLSRSDFWIVGMPVDRPSVKSSSFRKSPSLRFLYLRALSFFAALIASALMERSGGHICKVRLVCCMTDQICNQAVHL